MSNDDEIDLKEVEEQLNELEVAEATDLNALAFENRRVIIRGEIDDKTSMDTWMQLEALSKADDTTPIEISINSGGGSIYDCSFLVDYIRSGKPPIVTVGLSQCQSGAFAILISGQHRVIYRNTLLMTHLAQLPSDVADSRTLVSYSNKLLDIEHEYCLIMSEQSNLDMEFIQKKIHDAGDWYISSSEALEYGFVDEVIEPKFTYRNSHIWKPLLGDNDGTHVSA
jgi:ATP-dependent protease ClpP protease subunit